MITQELYELLSKQIAEMDARFTKQFETLDNRLRNVEVDVAEIICQVPRTFRIQRLTLKSPISPDKYTSLPLK